METLYQLTIEQLQSINIIRLPELGRHHEVCVICSVSTFVIGEYQMKNNMDITGARKTASNCSTCMHSSLCARI